MGECLSKGGFRELLYSSLHWYNLKTYYCGDCEKESDEEKLAGTVGEISETFVHERNPAIDKDNDVHRFNRPRGNGGSLVPKVP